MKAGETPRRAGVGVLLTAGVVVVASTAFAAPGDLDPAFGTGGKVTTDIAGGDDQAKGLAQQGDGKLVTAGFAFGQGSSDFALARHNPDGSLDTAFGQEGKVTTDIAGGLDEGRALAIQPDGKIVTGGLAYVADSADFALARYQPDGTLDSTFGDGGKVITDFSGHDNAAASVAVQADGMILAAGCTRCQKPNSDFALARYRPDGSLDPTFGDGGRVVTDFYDGTDGASAVAVADNGLIVAGGFAAGPKPTIIDSENRHTDFALARYNPNGSLDLMFGDEGKATADFTESNDDAAALLFQPDGKILTAGLAINKGNFDFALVRFEADGRRDPTFGTAGAVTTDFGGRNDQAAGLALESDGKILAAGLVQAAENSDFALARYNPNGTLDPTFGAGGKVTTDFAGADDAATAVVLRPDGNIVSAGFAAVDGSANFALAFYRSRLAADLPGLSRIPIGA